MYGIYVFYKAGSIFASFLKIWKNQLAAFVIRKKKHVWGGFDV